MKNKIFLVFGYGIPYDIMQDENYNFYLKTVFNKIYDFVIDEKNLSPLIMFCGGETDVFPPYKRTESDEMIRFFKNFISSKSFVKDVVSKWRFVSENKSLSTLENLINSKENIKKLKIKDFELFIFCEQTRERRIKIISKKIFDGIKIKVIPVDFDTSDNRYLPKKFILKKEKTDIYYANLALSSKENLIKHHESFQERIKFYRENGADNHVKSIRTWWENKLKELDDSSKNKK